MQFGDPCPGLLERSGVFRNVVSGRKAFVPVDLRGEYSVDALRCFVISCKQADALLILGTVDDEYPVDESVTRLERFL